MLERVRAPLHTLSVRLQRHELFVLAAALAYAAVLSIFPLAITVIAILGRFVEHARAQQAVADALRPYLPPQALASISDTLAAVAATRGTAGVIGIVGLLWAATTVAGTLRHGLNRVFDVIRPRSYLRRKLTDLVLVLLGGTSLSLSVAATGVLELAGRWAPAAAAASAVRDSPFAAALSVAGPWLFSAAAFFIVYRFLPNARMSRGALLAGTAVAMVLFEGAKRLFVWYLASLATYPVVYGPIAGLVVFMVWVYLIGWLVLFGGEVIVLIDRPAEVELRA